MKYGIFLFDLLSMSYLFIITFFGAYLLGSVPTGYLIVKALTGKDIRLEGSGSTGATNVKRVLGTKFFFLVLILDAIKGIIPVLLANQFVTLYQNIGLPTVIAAVAVIVGHSKSIFLGFKGGKSVATGVGTLLALNWQVGIIVAIIWGAVTFISGYVSLGSIIALIFSPFLMYFFHQPISYIIYCALGAIYIIYLHRENIKRLIKGNESKVK